MKVIYKGFEIDVRREKCLAGYPLLYFTVMRLSDGWFFQDGFYDSEDTVKDTIEGMKNLVDDYLENPEIYED